MGAGVVLNRKCGNSRCTFADGRVRITCFYVLPITLIFFPPPLAFEPLRLRASAVGRIYAF
jgi:hypothetical protein